jgi:hypothetical protein
MKKTILTLFLCSIAFFSANSQTSILYDFASDAVGSAPAGIYPELSPKLTTPTTVIVTAMSPITKGIKFSAGTLAASPSAFLFGNFPAADNDSVIWGEVISNAAVRCAMILRAQPQPLLYPSATYPVCRSGYAFQVNGSGSTVGGVVRIYKFSGATATNLNASANLGFVANVKYWFKAEANGSALKMYYSTVSRKGPWILAASATDATFTAGYTAWTENYGTNALGYATIDSVEMKYSGSPVAMKLDAPYSLSSTGKTTTSATIAWTAPATKSSLPVLKYKIYRNGTYVGSSNTTSYTDNGLLPSTTYTYAVSDSVAMVSGESEKTTASLGDLSVTTSASATGSITISNPVTCQIIQRDTITNLADIKIQGTYTGTPASIEASWNGGAYQTIVASPSGGTFTATLTNQTTGQGTLTVRFTDAPTITTTVATVGIGDVFILYGQSNTDGRGAVHTYTSPATGIKASLFTAGINGGSGGSGITLNKWVNLQDNNYCPDLATYLMAKRPNIPVGFVKRAHGGTAIANFLPGTADYTALSTAITNAIGTQNGKALAMLWYQGESDTNISTTASSYISNWTTIVNGVRSLTNNSIVGMAGIMGTDQYNATTTPSQSDTIRNAQVKIASLSNNLPGASMIDNCGNGLHYDNQTSLDFMGYRWFQTINKYLYNSLDYDAYPKLVPSSVLYYSATNTIELKFDSELARSGILLKDNNDNGPVTINSLPNGAAFNIINNGSTTSTYATGRAAITNVSLASDNRTVTLTLAAGTTINQNTKLSYASDWNGQRIAGTMNNGAGTGTCYPSTNGGNCFYSKKDFMPAYPFYNQPIKASITSINNTQKEKSSLTVYPNPVCKNMTVKLNSTYIGKVSINILDLQGRTIKKIDELKSDLILSKNIDVANLKMGEYIVCIQSTNKISSETKFIISR